MARKKGRMKLFHLGLFKDGPFDRFRRRALSQKECEQITRTGGFDLTYQTLVFFPGFLSCEGVRDVERDVIENGSMILGHVGGRLAYREGLQYYRVIYDRPEINMRAPRVIQKVKGWSEEQTVGKMGKWQDILHYKAKPSEHVSDEAERFVTSFLLPALQDSEGRFLEDAALKRRLNHLTLVSDSYGGIFVHEVETYLTRALQAHYKAQGQSEEAAYDRAREALMHVVHVGGANVAHVNKRRSFTHFFFQGRDDVMRQYVQEAAPLGFSLAKIMWFDLQRSHSPELAEQIEARRVQEVERQRTQQRARHPERPDLTFAEHPCGLSIDFYPPLQVTYEASHDMEGQDYVRQGTDLNPLAHATKSFIAPGQGEHSVVLARILCSSTQRDANQVPDHSELLLTPAAPMAVAGHGMDLEAPFDDAAQGGWIAERFRQRHKLTLERLDPPLSREDLRIARERPKSDRTAIASSRPLIASYFRS
jgi:hypothetical protein